MSLPGMVDGNIRVPKFNALYLAQRGRAYNDATYATSLGLREDGSLTIKPTTRTDKNQRPIPNLNSVELKASLMQTDIASIAQIVTFARFPHNVFVSNAHGDYFSFIQNGNLTTPNGSTMLGMKVKISIDKDTRKIESTWNSLMFKEEGLWLFDNMGALQTPAAGTGSGAAVTSLAYDRTKFRQSNWADVLIGGISVGHFGDAKLEFESKPGYTDNRDREFLGYLHAKGEVTMGQSTATELAELWDAAEIDQAIKFQGPNDSFEFTNGSVTVNPEVSFSEKEAMVKVSFEGEIPYTLCTFAGSAATFSFAT